MATRNPESSSPSHLEDSKTSNRDLTSDEKVTLRRAAGIYLRLSFLYFGGGVLFSAVLIRFVENTIRHSLKPEISEWGWVLAALAGIAFGWGKFQLWLRMLKDIQVGIVVSIWKKDNNGKDQLVKEYLPLSKFHLVNHEEPKDWRAR